MYPVCSAIATTMVLPNIVFEDLSPHVLCIQLLIYIYTNHLNRDFNITVLLCTKNKQIVLPKFKPNPHQQ